MATDMLINGPQELPPSHHSRRHAVALANSITTQANCGSAGQPPLPRRPLAAAPLLTLVPRVTAPLRPFGHPDRSSQDICRTLTLRQRALRPCGHLHANTCKASTEVLDPRFHVNMPRAACSPWRQHPRALSFPSGIDPHCACICHARLCVRPRTQTAGLNSQKACRPKHFRQARGGLLWTWTWPRRRGGMPTRFRVAGMIRPCCNLSTCPWEPSPGTRRLGL